MISKVYSGAIVGLEGVLIDVEVDVARAGFPSFTLVGLATKAVDEAKDRVRTAIINANFEMPDSRITVNLAPADLIKEGSSFDLPIAIGILASSGVIDKTSLEDSLFIGELSLEGHLRKIPGVISVTQMAREKKIKKLYVPYQNVYEASLIDDISIYPIYSLAELILHLNREKTIPSYKNTNSNNLPGKTFYEFDFAEINGQEQAKRALEIAASGFHNIHFKGSPGAGKTMLSRAFPSILPLLTKEESIEVSRIYSVAGLLLSDKIMVNVPFRSPHHTTSRMGLIGGGARPSPGEISLAHRGILFLDELPEFPRHVLESLRQPMEDGQVNISRARGSLTFPCRFLFIASSNPCPCGYLSHPRRSCKCPPRAILNYQKRLSGPLLDRIDLHIDVPPVEQDKLTSFSTAESSSQVAKRVANACQTQLIRFKGTGIKSNSQMKPTEIKNFCKLSSDSITLLKQAIVKLSLSARTYFKIIKISRTIADLENKDQIELAHIAEALQYRVKDE